MDREAWWSTVHGVAKRGGHGSVTRQQRGLVANTNLAFTKDLIQYQKLSNCLQHATDLLIVLCFFINFASCPFYPDILHKYPWPTQRLWTLRN